MARRQEGNIGKCVGGGSVDWRGSGGRWIEPTTCCDLNEVITFFPFFTFSPALKSKDEAKMKT